MPRQSTPFPLSHHHPHHCSNAFCPPQELTVSSTRRPPATGSSYSKWVAPGASHGHVNADGLSFTG
ncbi:hypothetical protein C8R44DRAFT_891773 [Mycena epipterygia]|nr:hypothetical protein C8R44DRAFT_891773 [Mycena epipterygia]